MAHFSLKIWAQFHGSPYRQIMRLRSRFPAYLQAANFCASLVSAECLGTWSMHAQTPEFAANLWNRLARSTEFPASVSADSWLTVSRAMKLGFDVTLWGSWKAPETGLQTDVYFHFWPTFIPHGDTQSKSIASVIGVYCLGIYGKLAHVNDIIVPGRITGSL